MGSHKIARNRQKENQKIKKKSPAPQTLPTFFQMMPPSAPQQQKKIHHAQGQSRSSKRAQKNLPTNVIATTTTVVNTGEEEEDQQYPISQREIRNRFHNTGKNSSSSSSKKVGYRIGYKRCCLRVGRMRGGVAAAGFLVYKKDRSSVSRRRPLLSTCLSSSSILFH
jgi:hypothetical protein